MSEIPKDLVEEILCRIPATDLTRLQLTCKEWNRLFKDDSRFARKHSDRTVKEFRAFMLTNYLRTPFVEIKNLVEPCSGLLDGLNITLAEPCDGLLLLSSTLKGEYSIMVWNLTGEKGRIIGCPLHEAVPNFVLGYGLYNNFGGKWYKILSFSDGEKDSEMYDFWCDSWRLIGDINPWNIRYSSYNVSLKGNAYWFGCDESDLYLVRFDFSTEKTSRSVPIPYQCHGLKAASLSIVREEKISVLLQRENNSKPEMWVTNKIDETSGGTWTKVMEYDLSPDIQIWNTISFLLDKEKKVVVTDTYRRE